MMIGVELGDCDCRKSTKEASLSLDFDKGVFTSEEFEKIMKALEMGRKVCIAIDRRLVNKKRLFATQTRIDHEKLSKAMVEETHHRMVSVTLRRRINSKGKVVIDVLVGDGTHRTSLALIGNRSITARVKNVWDEMNGGANPNHCDVVVGFNLIINKVRGELK